MKKLDKSIEFLSNSCTLRLMTALLITAILDFRRIGQSLWADELQTWLCSQSLDTVFGSCNPYPPHPLYYGLIYVITHLLGTDEISLRIASVFATAVSCEFIYRIAIFTGTRSKEALLAPLLFVSTVQALYHGSDARPYAMGNMFVLASFYTALNATASLRWTSLVISFLLAVCTTLTHPVFAWALFFPTAAFLVFFIRRAHCVAILLVTIPLLIALTSLPELQNLLRVNEVYAKAEGFSISKGLIRFLFFPIPIALLCIGSLFTLLSLGVVNKKVTDSLRKINQSLSCYTLLLAVIPGTFILLVSLLWRVNVIEDRYVFPATTFWAIASARIILHVLERFPNSLKGPVITSLMLVLGITSTQSLERTEHWREGLHFIARECQRHSDKTIIVQPSFDFRSIQNQFNLSSHDQNALIASAQYYSASPCIARPYILGDDRFRVKESDLAILFVTFDEQMFKERIAYLSQIFRQQGYQLGKLTSFGAVKVATLERTPKVVLE